MVFLLEEKKEVVDFMDLMESYMQFIFCQGISKALVKPIIDEIIGMGLSSMLVLVLKDNNSRHFYEVLRGEKINTVEVQIAGKRLIELVYGWEDIRNIF